MIQLSAVIITFNEERNIARCLESLRDVADEIIVVDSYSTDRTPEICKESGVRFLQRRFDGYTNQKNYANSQAAYSCILSLDADEALSPLLKQSILKVKTAWKDDGYTMNRLTNYCGKWIRHGGWYPDIKLRLFDNRKGKWKGELIHEEIVMDRGASVGELEGDLLHYSYYSIGDHVKQANYFTDLAAKELFWRGKRASLIKITLHPCIRFIRDYFIRLGILDGYYGYVIARISSHAVFLKYTKLHYLWKNGGGRKASNFSNNE
jgi:glycosyltransferase involved in cell wall biosynthesis